MNTTEPSDKQLVSLMHEVAVEAKRKAEMAQKQLAEKVKQLILNATLKNE